MGTWFFYDVTKFTIEARIGFENFFKIFRSISVAHDPDFAVDFGKIHSTNYSQ